LNIDLLFMPPPEFRQQLVHGIVLWSGLETQGIRDRTDRRSR
jgi:hypothetical protein